MALKYNLKSGVVLPPAVLFLFRITLNTLGYLCLHIAKALDFYIYFPSLVVLYKNSNTIFNICIFPDVNENDLNFSPFIIMLAIGFSSTAFDAAC